MTLISIITHGFVFSIGFAFGLFFAARRGSQHDAQD